MKTDIKMKNSPIRKILGWLQSKVSSQKFKGFAIGQPCACLSGKQISTSDEQYYNPEPHYDEEEEEFELFHGFPTNRTLGSGSSTPAFITGKGTEATENGFKIINDNDELEMVVRVDQAEENGYSDPFIISSPVSVSVSIGRSSHIMTLSRKQKEGIEISGGGDGDGALVCSFREYLLELAVELSETAMAKKEQHMTSLQELLQMSKRESDDFGVKCESDEKRAEKEAHKSEMKVKKKIQVSIRSSTATVASAETKLHKLLQLIFPQKGFLKEITRDPDHNSQFNPPHCAPINSYWIKTDPDYIILEI